MKKQFIIAIILLSITFTNTFAQMTGNTNGKFAKSHLQKTKKSVTLVSQTEVTKDFGDEMIRISAFETIGKPLEIKFEAMKSNSKFKNKTFKFAGDEGSFLPYDFTSFMSAYVRFKTMRVKNIESPIVLAVATQPGATNSSFAIKVIGAKDLDNPNLQELSPELFTTLWGGIHISELGGKRGTGIAVWDYIWDQENEARTGRHKYKVTFYPFNPKNGKFEKSETIETKNKHSYDKDALKELGLGFFQEQLDTVSGLSLARDRHW